MAISRATVGGITRQETGTTVRATGLGARQETVSGGSITTDAIATASFALTAAAVGSLNNRVTQIAAAAFLITAAAVGSLHHHKTPADSASFVITPASVGSFKAFTSQIDSASFAITPSAVASLYHHKSQINTASFIITTASIDSIYNVAAYGGIYNAVGYFTTGGTVTISLYDPINGDVVSLSSNACPEIGTTGLYVWDTTKLTTQPSGYQEYAYKMTNGTAFSGGILNMFDSADSVLLAKIGKYLLNKKITDPATGIMTVYEVDDTTPAFSAAVKKDAAGTIPYNGTGAERIERMT